MTAHDVEAIAQAIDHLAARDKVFAAALEAFAPYLSNQSKHAMSAVLEAHGSEIVQVANIENSTVTINLSSADAWPDGEARCWNGFDLPISELKLNILSPPQVSDLITSPSQIPPYVPREQDSELDSLIREALTTDLWENRIIIVSGPPKAGKTRSMLEALQRIDQASALHYAWPNIPVQRSPPLEGFEELIPAATTPLVVIIDDLQYHIGRSCDAVTASMLQSLVQCKRRRVIVVITCHEILLAPTASPATFAGPIANITIDPRLTKLMARNHVVLTAALTRNEQRSANKLLPEVIDQVAAASYHLGETLSCITVLERRYQTEATPYQRALIDAAVDWWIFRPSTPVTVADLDALARLRLREQNPTKWWNTKMHLGSSLDWGTKPVGTRLALLTPADTHDEPSFFIHEGYATKRSASWRIPSYATAPTGQLTSLFNSACFLILIRQAIRQGQLDTARNWMRALADVESEGGLILARILRPVYAGMLLNGLRDHELESGLIAWTELATEVSADGLCVLMLLKMWRAVNRFTPEPKLGAYAFGQLISAVILKYQDIIASSPLEKAASEALALVDALGSAKRPELPRKTEAALQRAIEAVAPAQDEAGLLAATVALGVLREKQDRLDDAAAAFQHAVESEHHEHAPSAAVHLGRVREKQDRLDDAAAAFQHAVESEHHEHAPSAAVRLGRVREKQDRLDDAAAAYEFAVESGHEEHAPAAAGSLGLLRWKQNLLDDAAAAYELAVESGHEVHAPHAAVSLGLLRWRQNLPDHAAPAFEFAVQSGHSGYVPSAAVLLGVLRQGAGSHFLTISMDDD